MPVWLSLALAADCAAFAATADRPIMVDVAPIDANDVAGQQATSPTVATGGVAVGPLRYDGYGVRLRSKDPRFATVRPVPGRGLQAACGYSAQGIGAWNARQIGTARATFRLVKAQSDPPIAPGVVAADREGAAPSLAGYSLAGSWPLGSAYLGLMRPTRGTGSVIVGFAKAGPTRVLAKLPIAFDTIDIVPAMHEPTWYINLAGRDGDGAIALMVLALPEPARRALSSPAAPIR